HDPDTRKWEAFDPHKTVFQDALNAGYSTAVAGWYNPYCRILAPVLDRCFWTFQLPYPGGMVLERPISRNILLPLVRRIHAAISLLSHPSAGLPKDTLEGDQHIADYLELRKAGDSMLADADASFVLLHMPIPHPEGIYDRRNTTLSSIGGSYVDNLALADAYLAHVRGLLQQRGEWDSSTIVIMGDHSWRTSFIWSKMEGWTAEDNAASHGGQFDDRPAYIVKLPQQQHALRIDAPFKAIHTRSLLDALLTDQFHNAKDLKIWVEKQR
ncbi:MAG: hypothetical protein ABI158_08160, partial [Edaphobacter sp.]